MPKRKWAEDALEKLQSGSTAVVIPKGNSMQGRVSEGDLVTLEPCSPQDLAVGDVVLARIQGRRYSHLVLHLIHEREANLFLIGSNHSRLDGWVTGENIFGKVTDVESSTDEVVSVATEL